MDVEEISGRLEGLSMEELQVVRDHEELHEGRRTMPLRGRGVAASALLLALIHPSAWKGYSAKFARKFTKHHPFGGSDPPASRSMLHSLPVKGGPRARI